MLMLLAFLAGLGGGNFVLFMPSTSLFFEVAAGHGAGHPGRRRQPGVSIVQFVTPWIIGFALCSGGAAFAVTPRPDQGRCRARSTCRTPPR